MIYTAQYRYAGQDRLDITVKGNCPAGKEFAPTWPMVMGVKNGSMTEAEYTEQYFSLLIGRYKADSETTINLVNMVSDRDLTVVCFCPNGSFCHRYLLVRYLSHNWDVQYGGERNI